MIYDDERNGRWHCLLEMDTLTESCLKVLKSISIIFDFELIGDSGNEIDIEF